MNCKEYHKMIAAFDKQELEFDKLSGFVKHVAGCDDCKEEYELYYIAKYALSEDDAAIDRELMHEPQEVIRMVQSYNFKGLVEYRLKAAQAKVEHVRNNENYNYYLFAIAEFSVIVMAVFYLFGDIFM